MKFPIEKPPPVRRAPPEAREDQWPWRIGSEYPPDLQQACQVWFRHAEAYLLEFHDIQGWCGQSCAGRSDGLRVQHAELDQAWKSELRQNTT
eukprot:4577589-Pyramimonas_sp.AAC.1